MEEKNIIPTAENPDVRYSGSLFNAKGKLADLVMANCDLLPVLERMGISLGFGEATVEDICRRYGISTELFLIISRIHTTDGFTPRPEAIDPADLSEIVAYLHKSHQYYNQRQVPRLKAKLRAFVCDYDAANKQILEKFFNDYEAELSGHFEYEETTVFPYVNSLVAGIDKGGYSIHRFKDNHSNIEEKLNDLKSIILKYLPSEGDPELRNEILIDIFRLEDDIRKHTLIENMLLIPLVARLEKKQYGE